MKVEKPPVQPAGEVTVGYVLKGYVRGKLKILGTANGPDYRALFNKVLKNSNGVTNTEVLEVDLLNNKVCQTLKLI